MTSSPVHSSSYPATLPSIWLVDDDQDDQLLIQSAFQILLPPVDVQLLDDGAKLLATLPQATALPKVILLDLNMPGLNGFDTLQRLRQQDRYEDLPVVVLTTSSAQRDRQRAMDLGANDFLTKPVKYDDLVALSQQIAQRWL